MKAPQIANIILQRQNNTQVFDEKSVDALMRIWRKMQNFEIQGGDELRELWIYAERGDIHDFGSYEEYLEEEIVENKQEFEEMWLYEYPNEKRWYKFSVNRYNGEVFFYFDAKLLFQINGKYNGNRAFPINLDFAQWLEAQIDFAISEMHKDPPAYNQFVSENLPHSKRFGKILRRDFWTVFPQWAEDFRPFNKPEIIEILTDIAEKSENLKTAPKTVSMSAGDFYAYCQICYDANNYFDKSDKILSPKEKYLAMADGRDCGLRNIDEHSEAAFRKWYATEMNCGGHPWEICRGGNSTHISLAVISDKDEWILSLAGNSRSRVSETLKMALALYRSKVPFYLRHAKQILDMVQGIDYIGIVPEYIFPRYCHSHFPEEDRIDHFMNLGFEKTDALAELTHWYPIKYLKLAEKQNF